MHIDKFEIATYYIWDKAKCHSLTWLVGIFMLANFQVKSQTFPVTATTQVTPPYSVFLADYTLPETNQLKLNLLLRDVSEPSYDVRLHFSIEGAGIKIESRNNIVVPPITLEGGVPRLLTALELAPYLDNNNLSFSGITRRAYETAGALPDGFYRMCFRVVDYRRPDVVLSRSSCANAWFILNDPPRINLPQCGNILPLQDPQNIFFQWLPMNTGSPNAAFNTEYLLEIYEIRPAGRNPNEVVRTANPIFRTTTDFTTYVYGLADPPLIPGLSYAFRVQARDKSGRDLFKNDGFSEVCSFTFGEVNTLEAPTNISTVVESERRARVSWDTNNESTGYSVEYRKSGNQSFTWFEADVQETEYLMKDLEPDTDYELRVYSVLDNFKSAASPNERFKTPAPQVFSCGSSYGAILPENRTPLTTAMVGNIIKVGNFEMKLLEVSGGDGVFSGYGAVMIPYLGTQIVSKFTNVKINELQELFEGEVFALTEGVDGLRDRWEDEEEADDSDGDNSDSSDDSSDNGNIEIDHAGDIDTVYIDINTGDIVVVDANGDETVYDGPETNSSDEENDSNEDIIITDENGDTWTVDSEGNVSQGGSDGGIEDVIGDTEAKRDKYLKFIIAGTDYMDADNYYTMYTKKELEIEVVQTDTVNRDLSKITWELEGNKMIPDKDDPTILRFKVKKSNLPKSKNDLLVLDSAGNKISKLKIQTYRGPEIVFDEANIYNGEYLFDHGYEFNSLKGDYSTFSIGPNNDTYYAPVLGILEGGYATIRLNVKQLKAEASKDPNFNVVIKPSRPGFISIDNLDSLVLNAQNLNSTPTIIVKALKTINSVSLDSISINAYVSETNEKIGKMEFYCADRVAKKVKLIFVKYSDETNYPSYLNPATFETFLDDQVMNQLFLDYQVETDTLNSTYTTSLMQSWTKYEILDSLNVEFHGTDNPVGYSNTYDYFYITNLSIPGSNPGSYLGAFHKVGAPGGVQVKYRNSSSGETAEEATAHEFGHWMGLPHTFGSNALTGGTVINSAKGGTRDNYMDYNIKRKKWFKRQLVNYDR